MKNKTKYDKIIVDNDNSEFVKIHETEIGYPLFNIIATIQLAKPTTDPIDKSIPAVINTTV